MSHLASADDNSGERTPTIASRWQRETIPANYLDMANSAGALGPASMARLDAVWRDFST
jgi:hypothetical protein